MATEKRLIDADEVLEKIKKMPDLHYFAEWYVDYGGVCNILKNAPTVDAVELVHGRWIEAEDGDGAVCSVCGEDFCNVYLEVERFLYCPNCGADMRERKDNG